MDWQAAFAVLADADESYDCLLCPYNWQLYLVGLIVAVAAAYLARRAWRTWARKASGCGGGCGTGCHDKSAGGGEPARLIPVDQIAVRRREHE